LLLDRKDSSFIVVIQQNMRAKIIISTVLTVTDIGTRVCVDPGGKGAIMNVGGEGGPGPPGRGRDEQMVTGSGDG
jgi:hypothetical protein